MITNKNIFSLLLIILGASNLSSNLYCLENSEEEKFKEEIKKNRGNFFYQQYISSLKKKIIAEADEICEHPFWNLYRYQKDTTTDRGVRLCHLEAGKSLIKDNCRSCLASCNDEEGCKKLFSSLLKEISKEILENINEENINEENINEEKLREEKLREEIKDMRKDFFYQGHVSNLKRNIILEADRKGIHAFWNLYQYQKDTTTDRGVRLLHLEAGKSLIKNNFRRCLASCNDDEGCKKLFSSLLEEISKEILEINEKEEKEELKKRMKLFDEEVNSMLKRMIY